MKVVIMTDLEGISGVNHPDHIYSEPSEMYQYAVGRLMADLYAAVEGALDGGATEVYVVDGHHSGKNFIKEKLHPKAKQVSFAEWREFIRSGEIDAYMEVGCHAMAGTMNGFFDHTQSSKSWYNYYVNGKKTGEIGQGAQFVGAFGVPMVMVSGDLAACVEGRAFLGDIATAIVKEGIGWASARCIDLKEAEEKIRAAACEGLKRVKDIRPYKVQLPAEVKLEFFRADQCDEYCKNHPEVERMDARTVRKLVFEINSYLDLLF